MTDEPPPVPRLAEVLNRRTAPNSAPAPVLRLHRWIHQRTGGRIGHGMIGAPTLLLRTTGRRSGQPRTTALVYGRDGDSFVLAASNDGADRHPAWFLNLLSNPHVEAQIGRRHLSGNAAVVDATDPRYPRLWATMNATNNGRFNHYQSKTTRPIPIVLINPDHPL